MRKKNIEDLKREELMKEIKARDRLIESLCKELDKWLNYYFFIFIFTSFNK